MHTSYEAFELVRRRRHWYVMVATLALRGIPDNADESGRTSSVRIHDLAERCSNAPCAIHVVCAWGGESIMAVAGAKTRSGRRRALPLKISRKEQLIPKPGRTDFANADPSESLIFRGPSYVYGSSLLWLNRRTSVTTPRAFRLPQSNNRNPAQPSNDSRKSTENRQHMV